MRFCRVGCAAALLYPALFTSSVKHLSRAVCINTWITFMTCWQWQLCKYYTYEKEQSHAAHEIYTDPQ